jgi:hypothetical protein
VQTGRLHVDADLRHPGLQHQEQRRAEHHLCQLCPQRSPVREHCHVQGTGETELKQHCHVQGTGETE